jgi:uncharacterized protein
MNERKQLKYFLFICFGFSFLISLLVKFTGGHDSKYIWVAYLSMFIPAIAVLLMRILFKLKTDNPGWGKFPLKWLPVALLLMPLIIHAICIPLETILNNNSIPWQSWLHPDENGLFHSPTDRNWGTLTNTTLLIRILLNMFTGLLFLTILAFFEEIGWRVWMLPRLLRIFDTKKAVLAGAIIWALWHTPFDISGIHFIKGVSVYQTVFLNPFGYVGAGIVIAWFWIKTKSIWIVCLAHSALNNWGQYAFKFIEDDTNAAWLHLGVNGTLLILGLVILLFIKIQDGVSSVTQNNS